jgi:hypothetical protein
MKPNMILPPSQNDLPSWPIHTDINKRERRVLLLKYPYHVLVYSTLPKMQSERYRIGSDASSINKRVIFHWKLKGIIHIGTTFFLQMGNSLWDGETTIAFWICFTGGRGILKKEKKLVIDLENNCATTKTPANRTEAYFTSQESHCTPRHTRAYIIPPSNSCSNKRTNE